MTLTCRRCNGSVLSISTVQGTTTWWRCGSCSTYTPSHPGDPWPEPIATDGPPVANAPSNAPASVPTPPAECGVCGSPDTTYALSTDVTGRAIRVDFCSIACLAKKLGFDVIAPRLADSDTQGASGEGGGT